MENIAKQMENIAKHRKNYFLSLSFLVNFARSSALHLYRDGGTVAFVHINNLKE